MIVLGCPNVGEWERSEFDNEFKINYYMFLNRFGGI